MGLCGGELCVGVLCGIYVRRRGGVCYMVFRFLAENWIFSSHFSDDGSDSHIGEIVLAVLVVILEILCARDWI